MKNHVKRMEAIDNFFENVPLEKIEEKIINAGAGQIIESVQSDYVQTLSSYYNWNLVPYLFRGKENSDEFTDDLGGAA